MPRSGFRYFAGAPDLTKSIKVNKMSKSFANPHTVDPEKQPRKRAVPHQFARYAAHFALIPYLRIQKGHHEIRNTGYTHSDFAVKAKGTQHSYVPHFEFCI